MRGAIPLLSQYVFMAWCLVKHRENFTFFSIVELADRGSTAVKGNDRNISLHHRVQSGSGAHPASCRVSPGGLLPQG